MPINNRRHLEYIGERKGVLIGHGASSRFLPTAKTHDEPARRYLAVTHGVFGFINGKAAEDTEDIKDLGRYIEAKTKAKTNVYRIILSLAEADALRVGYDNYETWEELVKSQMPMIADKVGIKIQDLEWGAGVHMKKGNPHCHIMFWDKNQKIKNPFVHWSVSNKIRIDITKEIYKDDLSKLYNIKNAARTATLNGSDDFFKDFLKPFEDMTGKEFIKAVAELKTAPDLCDGGIIYNRFSNKELAELAKLLFDLKDKLPKSGRLNMKLMPPETKVDIEAFAEKLLELNVDCKREFDKYVETAAEISSYYNTDENVESARENAHDELMKRLCNKILSEMKTINKMEYAAKSHIRQEDYRKQLTVNLITEVFSFLVRQSQAEENSLNGVLKGELSKQAKKEYALKMQNTSDYDWER